MTTTSVAQRQQQTQRVHAAAPTAVRRTLSLDTRSVDKDEPGGEESCPRGGDGRSVLPGKQEHDEQSHDLVVGVDAAVLVLHVYQELRINPKTKQKRKERAFDSRKCICIRKKSKPYQPFQMVVHVRSQVSSVQASQPIVFKTLD